MAEQPSTNGTTGPALEALYSSPISNSTFTQPLPTLPKDFSVEQKTAFLSQLRQSVVRLQEDVNAFLTQKMEEDKADAVKGGQNLNDVKEEENYGEEVVDEEG
jgi:hypothetical protein